MAPMSQMSSSLKPWPCSAAKSASPMAAESSADLHREIEHGLLARRDVGLAVVDRHLVGDQRILLVDAQDGAVGDHAVLAAVGVRGGDHDHLALGLGQAAVLFHQRVVVGEEGAPLGGPVRQGQEDVGHEAGFLLHREDARRACRRAGRRVRERGSG
jgi:hypothetical protein